MSATSRLAITFSGASSSLAVAASGCDREGPDDGSIDLAIYRTCHQQCTMNYITSCQIYPVGI